MPADPRLVWLLDVDGVLNVEHPDARVHRSLKLRVQGWPVEVHVDPQVVDRIAAIAASGVRVVWLTTWGDDAATELAPRLGMTPDLEVLYQGDTSRTASRPGDSLGHPWWKLEAALALLERDQPAGVVWTDDDLDDSVRADLAGRWAGPAMLLAPDARIGLTEVELGKIARFVEVILQSGSGNS